MDANLKSFDAKSDQYALSRPKYPAEFYNYLVSLVDSHDRLWDCACGNGQVAIDLVDYFDELYATDVSENQINNAFKHQKINYAVTPSEQTSFPDSFFDMICVAQAFHWFDFGDFFNEVDRILKKNGILAIFGYGFFKINSEIDKLIGNVLRSVIDEYWSERNQLHVSGFKGVEFPFKKVDTPQFSMNQNWNLPALLSYLNTWSAVKRYNEHNNEDIVDTLKTHLELIWDFNESKTVKMDFYCFIRRK